jgi:vacuolar-type H+-ATPase subunit I/STV1
MATVDFAALAKELNQVVGQIGVKKVEIQQVKDGGGDSQAARAAIEAVTQFVAKLQERAAETTITKEEQQRKLEELQGRIRMLQIIDATSDDLEERLEAEREISRLSSLVGVYQSETALRFDQLLGEDALQLVALIEQAKKEIAARANLGRVLKGVELVLRAGAFMATLAAKLAIAAAK